LVPPNSPDATPGQSAHQPPPLTVPLPFDGEPPLETPLPEIPPDPDGEVECGGEDTGGEDDAGGAEDTGGEDDAGGGDDTGGDDEAGGEYELPPESPPEVPALTTPELVPLIPEGATYTGALGGAERAATVVGAEVRTTSGLRLGFRLRLWAAAAECLVLVLSAAAGRASCVATGATDGGVTDGAVTRGRAGVFTGRLVVFPGNRVTATAAATVVAGTADTSAARRGDGRRGRRRRS
jgi:hypothetical protein